MDAPALVLVEPSHPGNVGAVIRVAANLGVRDVALVRPAVSADDDEEIRRWACGGDERVRIRRHDRLGDAVADARTVVATASTRGRSGQPVLHPAELVGVLRRRGAGHAALVFGSETRGLSRSDLDRCDLVVRIPSEPDFPVLNLAQAVAVLLGYLRIELGEARPSAAPEAPATHAAIAGLMEHLRDSLLTIGFLDPQNPDRILRKLRRLVGRAVLTDDEVRILRGVCRQIQWAARRRPGRYPPDPTDS